MQTIPTYFGPYFKTADTLQHEPEALGSQEKRGNLREIKSGDGKRTSQKEAQLWQKYAWHKFPNNLVSHLLVLVLMLMLMALQNHPATSH